MKKKLPRQLPRSLLPSPPAAIGRRAFGAISAQGSRLRKPKRFAWLWRCLAIIGPGIIVSNAGNDAGGIFTYSNAGAKYGLALLWTFIPILVALIITQEMVARLGCVTGKGLMDLIRERFGARWTLFAAIVVIIANGGTTIAEFAGIAAALEIFGVPLWIAVISAACMLTLIVLRGNRQLVERIFLALGLTFLTYVITAFTVHANLNEITRALVIPSFAHQNGLGPYVIDVIAVIGTSITPYMQLFLQSSIVDKGTSENDLTYVRLDVISGSIFAMLVAGFIVITTAATLFAALHGQGVNSAKDAAEALAPLVGVHAQQLFAAGLLGASLLAAAVLPLSTAFVVCEAFGAERSVQRRFSEAPLFFVLFIGIMFISAAVMLIPGIPIAGVAIGTQTLDGILLPILLVFIIILANDRDLLGKHCNSKIYNWIAITLATTLSSLTGILVITTLFPQLLS